MSFHSSLLDILIALPALTGMTIVLGMNNMVVLAVLLARARPDRRERVRRLCMGLAMVTRLSALLLIVWIFKSAEHPFVLWGHQWHVRALLSVAAGVFLLYLGTKELFQRARQRDESAPHDAVFRVFHRLVFTILIVDLMISMDSIVAVIAIAPSLLLMVLPIAIEVVVDYSMAGSASRFIRRFPSLGTLAICTLLLVGLASICAGLGHPIRSTEVYAMMGFALFVEIVNLRIESVAMR